MDSVAIRFLAIYRDSIYVKRQPKFSSVKQRSLLIEAILQFYKKPS